MVIAAGDADERVDVLTIFIGIAHVLFSSLGNLNAFMAVMEGLETTQVRLASFSCLALDRNDSRLKLLQLLRKVNDPCYVRGEI